MKSSKQLKNVNCDRMHDQIRATASEHIGFTEAIFSRAKELERWGVKSFDALHVASAEAAEANVFLTTDRRLINATKRAETHIPVRNPLVWLTEVFYGRES